MNRAHDSAMKRWFKKKSIDELTIELVRKEMGWPKREEDKTALKRAIDKVKRLFGTGRRS